MSNEQRKPRQLSEAFRRALDEEDKRDMESCLLQWTSDKPTKPGWYWYREKSGDVYIVQVEEDNDWIGPGDLDYERFLMAKFIEAEFGERVDRMSGGEWAGPLEPPR